MKIYYGSFSECGSRNNNEDFVSIRQIPEQNRSVFVLCDGMGGHEDGEVASKLVAEHICDYWEKNPKRRDSVKKVLDACDETMIAFNNRSRGEMGTTMAMVAFEGNKATLAHCGDSRIYVVRKRKIIYQSVDHVALTPEGWPIITRAFFTGRSNYKPDIKEMEVQVGDIILICSDGVYGNGKWSAVNEVLMDSDSASYPLSRIERIAADKAHDNYSAILIRVCDDEPEDKRDPNLFKLRRRRKNSDDNFEYFEFFRTRTEAHYRLIELAQYGKDKEIYQYGVSHFPK